MLANLGFVSRLDVSSVAYPWKKQSRTQPCPRCKTPVFAPETRTRACWLEPRLCKRLSNERQPLTPAPRAVVCEAVAAFHRPLGLLGAGPGGDDLRVQAAVVCGFDQGAAGAGEVLT